MTQPTKIVKTKRYTKRYAKKALVDNGKQMGVRSSSRINSNSVAPNDGDESGEIAIEEEEEEEQESVADESIAGGRHNGPVVQVADRRFEDIFLQVPKIHKLVSLSTIVTNGNNQRRCGHPGCTSRPNKFCSGCSDVLGKNLRLVCFCYVHFPFHIASQCYNSFKLLSDQPEQLSEQDIDE